MDHRTRTKLSQRCIPQQSSAATTARSVLDRRDSEDLEPVFHEFRFKLFTDVELERLAPPQYLLQNWLVAGGLHVLWGPPGVGKSFVSLDSAMSVGYGVPWLGHATMFGPTIYLLGEGVSGFRDRVASGAMLIALDPTNKPPPTSSPGAPS